MKVQWQVRGSIVASGYEKSEDYGGTPPGWRSFVASALAAGIVFAVLLSLL